MRAAGEAGFGAAPPARSAVKAISTDCTPGTARIASSARFRTGSQAFTAAASTVMDKNTLPSLTTISDSVPVCGKGRPSGAGTRKAPAKTRLAEEAAKPSGYHVSEHILKYYKTTEV